MNKNIFIAPLLIVLFSFSLTLLIFSPVSFKNIAQALTGNYSKSTGEQLTITDWNNLSSDFIAKSGDTMSGSLNMNNNQITNVANPTADNHAVNRGTMNSAITTTVAAIPTPTLTNTSGNAIQVVCGKSSPADWVTYLTTGDTVYVDVDMSAAGFTSTPNIVTSIYGIQQHWKTYGATSIYDATPTSFRVYVFSIGLGVNETIAQSWGWGISWCAYGD